jgi:hypothetical protein
VHKVNIQRCNECTLSSTDLSGDPGIGCQDGYFCDESKRVCWSHASYMVFTLRLTMSLTDVCDLYYFLYFFKKPTSGYSFAKNADPFSAKFDVCDQSKLQHSNFFQARCLSIRGGKKELKND